MFNILKGVWLDGVTNQLYSRERFCRKQTVWWLLVTRHGALTDPITTHWTACTVDSTLEEPRRRRLQAAASAVQDAAHICAWHCLAATDLEQPSVLLAPQVLAPLSPAVSHAMQQCAKVWATIGSANTLAEPCCV